MHEMSQVCSEKYKAFKEELSDHSSRLKVLEKDSVEYKTEIRNLIKKMDDLMNTIKWGLGFFIAAVGLFITIIKI